MTSPEVSPDGQDPRLQERYDRAVDELVPAFMEQHRLNISGLANILDVERSTLTRFLNRTEGYEPRASRPRMLAILQKISQTCVKRHLTTLPDLSVLDGVSDEGEAEWFRDFVAKVMTILDEEPSAATMDSIRSLSAQAFCAPQPLAASMATNLLYAIASLTERPFALSLSPDILGWLANRLESLEERALATATPRFMETVAHRPIGYAGYGLAQLGRLSTRPFLEAGFERLIRACMMPHSRDDRHWMNLLSLVETMLEEGEDGAEDYARRVILQLQGHQPDEFKDTLLQQSFPRWVALWEQAGSSSATADSEDRENLA